MNLGEAPSVANFGERWSLACFCASKPLFWHIKWWRFRIWCGGKPICGGAPFYRRFPVKVASSPLCATNPPGCFSGCVARLFSGCVARLFFWLCRQVVFLAVSPGCFSGCVARLFFWLICQGLFSDSVVRSFVSV